jgi:hypothetical protein
VEGDKYRKVPGTREDNWVWSPQGFIDMHRPEYWGLVQFSTAAPGTTIFRPDPASQIRDRLIEIYHAQKRFHEKNKRWADRIDALELPAEPAAVPEHTLTLRPVTGGFEAAITFEPERAGKQTWTIREDSRLELRP